jgi:enamine deaminase RidA (YjgF/YER057c/UK114 family)
MSSVVSLPINRVPIGGKSSLGEFPRALRVGNTLFIGAQLREATEAKPDVAERTHSTFQEMVSALDSSGMTMANLVKLHTYYVYEGEGSEVTKYWERMTDVRLKYLANPGPAATALRVQGVPSTDNLITVDGIAVVDEPVKRLMPAHAWDWSIPTPFSQGWLVGNKIYVGGQLSADRKGKAVAPWDALEQTKNTLEFIRHVLLEGGSSWNDVVTLKVAYRHDGRDEEANKQLQVILDLIRQTLPSPGPAITCIGVDLLYEGLVLEIDAVAVIGGKRENITAAGSEDWQQLPGFTPAVRVDDEVYVSAASAPGGASLVAQAESSMERFLRTLVAAEARPEDLVKLNVFYRSDAKTQAADAEEISRIVAEYLPGKRPVLSVICVPGLPLAGQRVQIDGVAIVPDAS